MANEWQPIETAPKDGTVILLAAKGLEDWIQMTGSWAVIREIDWYFVGGGWMGVNPTHWMKLPEPPKIDDTNTPLSAVRPRGKP